MTRLTRFLWVAFLTSLLAACGGGSAKSTDDTTPTPTPTNSAPTIELVGSVDVLEGNVSVATATATDADGDDIEFSLSGSDSALFGISATGEITFAAAPDFEAPADEGGTNNYELTVTASDGTLSNNASIVVNVTNALEGRVIDGPISGAAVFIDLNDNGQQDDGEPSGITDADGFFAVDGNFTIADGTTAKFISIGGTDTSTGKVLPNLALISDVPADPTKAFYATPLSTIIAAAATPEAKAAVLTSLGISGTVEDLITLDIWAAAGEASTAGANATATQAAALAIYRANVQVAVILQAATNTTSASASGGTADLIAVLSATVKAVAEVFVAEAETAAAAGVSLDLTSTTLVQTALTTAVKTAAADIFATLSTDIFAAIAEQTAAVNVVLGQESIDLTSALGAAIITGVQQDLIAAVQVVAAAAQEAVEQAQAAGTAIQQIAADTVTSIITTFKASASLAKVLETATATLEAIAPVDSTSELAQQISDSIQAVVVLVAKAEEIETALESGESVDIVIELPSVAVGGSKDTTAPTVIVSAAASSLTAGGTTTITFTFSEVPFGFTNDDVTVVGGTLATVTVSSTDAKIYTATFTAASSGSTSGSVTVKAGSYTDAAGNAG